ncbi:MAG: hypothetical protein ACYTG2_18100 [Planctomycetota bacterium]
MNARGSLPDAPARRFAGRCPGGVPERARERVRAVGRGAPALLAALALAACSAVVPPHDPPPNVPPGLTLLELPDAVVESLATQEVEDKLGTLLLGQHLGANESRFPAGRREQILNHRIVTGMTVREVVFCFLADPVRQRHQGPPGGQTLLWEPPDLSLGRYWVRFDERGLAVDAGRY